MTRRRLRRTAMPQSWRPITEHKVEQFGDVVIATEIVNTSRGSRYYSIYTYGQLFGTAHSLADAKYQVEVIYGPLRWHRQPNPPVEVIHYYFGRTTEFTEPTTIYTADLPMLGYAASRRTAYQLTHRPDSEGAPLHDLTSQFPPDVYSHPHYYSFGGDEMGERKSHAIIREFRDQPDKPITIYRAVPDGVMSINTGDWVTITREYAAVHALHPTDPEQDYPIISATVPARTLLNGGNDLLEWGYWGPPITGRTASRHVASSNIIYRGFQVALPSHIEDAIWQLNEPPTEEPQIGQHQRIGRILVGWLQDNHWESGLGLGRHWTRRHAMAEAAAMRGGAAGGWGIILTANYSLEDENPDLHNTTPSLAQSEDEVNLRPGAPLTITDVEIVGWGRSLIDSSIQATASRKTASNAYYHGTIWPLREGNELLPPSRSGKPANYAAGTGNPDTVYVTTDKAEAYWYGIIGAVASGFPGIKPSVYEISDLANSRDSTLYPGLETLADSGIIGRNVTDEAKHEFERFLADSKWQLIQDTAPHQVQRFAPYLLSRSATRKQSSTSGPYYHGTPFYIPIGDTILPASKNLMGHSNFSMSRGDRIYLTNDIGEAYWWAAMASATAPMNVHPNVYRVDNVENPQVSSAMGQFELLAESAEVVEDVTEQAKAAWLAKGSNRYQQVVNMGGIEDSPRNRGYFLIASRNASRKTGNYLTELDPHIQHPDTRYALNLITEALAALPDPHALSLAKQVRIYLAGKPNPDSEKEQAIQRFLIRYADKIIKSHGDQPAASVPNYQSRELQQAWETLTPHL